MGSQAPTGIGTGSRARIWDSARVGAIAVLAVGIELAQWARLFTAKPSDPLVVVTGSTFDVWELVSYAVGLALAVTLERMRGRSQERGS